METIFSGLRAAGTMFSSARQATSQGANSAVSWFGKQIVWVASSLKSAVSITSASNTNSDFGTRQNLADSSASSAGISAPITAKVNSEQAPQQVSFKKFACYEAIARVLDNNRPNNMPPRAKSELNLALSYFDMCTNPGASKAQKKMFKDGAVQLTTLAISKCSTKVKVSIKETLTRLERQYNDLQEEMNSISGELEMGLNKEGDIEKQNVIPIDPQEIVRNIKAQLLKTAQASLGPQNTNSPTLLQQSLKIENCNNLKAQLKELRAKISSYPKHFRYAETMLKYAEEYYRAENFSLGDKQYDHASAYINFLESQKLIKATSTEATSKL